MFHQQTLETLLIYLGIAIISYLSCICYIKFFLSFSRKIRTPTGAGVVGPLLLLFGSLYFSLSTHLILANICVIAFTALYWIDDIFGLTPKFRIKLILSFGMALFSIFGFYNFLNNLNSIYLLISVVIFIPTLLVMVNVVNFYDGANLNVALLISQFCLIGLLFFEPGSSIFVFSICWIAFTSAFALKNYKKDTLFFGDSGCFAFAGTVCVIFFLSVSENNINFIYFIFPIALPVLDVFVVITLRILLSENLLTRNYLHLYQRLQSHHPLPFFYLFPQIVSFLGLLNISLILDYLKLSSTISITTSVIIFVPIVYFFFYLKYGNLIPIYRAIINRRKL